MALKSCLRIYLWKNRAENIHQKLVPDLFVDLANNQNSNSMQEILLNIRYFKIGLSKS